MAAGRIGGKVTLQKLIQWAPHERKTLVCDGRCDKAWGINNRPSLYFQEEGQPPRALREDEEPRNYDDHVFVPDSHLGTAPACPGTWEGGEGKPSAVPLTVPSLMNKWCVRECERSDTFWSHEEVVAPDLERPKPNMYGREVKW